MPYSLRKILFLGILFLPSHSALGSPISPRPDPPELTITHPTNLTTPSNAAQCVLKTGPFSPRAKYADCALAINQLPQFPTSRGVFHNGGANDPFRLPVERTVSSCIVRVEIYAASTTVAGWWPGIAAHASAVNGMCLYSALLPYKGGWTTYAREGRIVISLGPSDPWGGEGSGADDPLLAS